MPHQHDPAHEAEAEYAAMGATEWSHAGLPNTFPSGETVRADRRDAVAEHRADRPPTPEEEAAPGDRRVDPAVSAAYRAATRRGVEQHGEGRI